MFKYRVARRVVKGLPFKHGYPYNPSYVTQPRYPGPYIVNRLSARRYSSSGYYPLPMTLPLMFPDVRRTAGVIYGPGFRSLARTVPVASPVYTPVDPQRMREIERRSLNKPDFKVGVNSVVNQQRFIDRYGYELFRQKVCEDRKIRREVMHARGLTGQVGQKPAVRDLVSQVRC